MNCKCTYIEQQISYSLLAFLVYDCKQYIFQKYGQTYVELTIKLQENQIVT